MKIPEYVDYLERVFREMKQKKGACYCDEERRDGTCLEHFDLFIPPEYKELRNLYKKLNDMEKEKENILHRIDELKDKLA